MIVSWQSRTGTPISGNDVASLITFDYKTFILRSTGGM